MLAIVNYKLGNLYSLKRALDHLGAKCVITDDPDEISQADRIILPGVGAFGQGISHLRGQDLEEPVLEAVREDKPLLGICLGMQLLLGSSEELGEHRGLELIPGRVVYFRSSLRFDASVKTPHVGWNELRRVEPGGGRGLLENVREGDCAYFNHSLIASVDDANSVVATTEYGELSFPSVIRSENVYGCQFHPEKSGDVGLGILRSFLAL